MKGLITGTLVGILFTAMLLNLSPSFALSDTTPPALVSFEVSPPIVKQGETVTVTVVTTDDLSGVREVSVSYRDANNNFQYFLMQRLDGDTWQGTLSIHQYAALGTWRIRELWISDKTGNYLSLLNKEFFPYAAGAIDMSFADFLVISASSETGAIAGQIEARNQDTATVRVSELDITARPNAQGTFAFVNVPPGTYTLEVTMPFHICRPKTIVVQPNKTTTAILKPLFGDYNGDGVIDLFDLVAVAKNYGSTAGD